MFYYCKKSNSEYWHDFRNFADDKTVLDNPRRGWYLHYIDNGMAR